MSPVSGMTSSQVTIELVDLIGTAGVHEREVVHIAVTDRVPEQPPTVDALRDMLATLPDDEQRRTLLLARRLIKIGQLEYGALDPKRDTRDYRAEVLAEYVDAVVYLCAELIRSGKRSPLHNDAVDLMRRGMDLALRFDAA